MTSIVIRNIDLSTTQYLNREKETIATFDVGYTRSVQQVTSWTLRIETVPLNDVRLLDTSLRFLYVLIEKKTTSLRFKMDLQFSTGSPSILIIFTCPP